jgi:hypothetical protein
MLMNNNMSFSEENIPKIELSTKTDSFDGILGSYCWNNICITKAMPYDISNSHKIIISQDSIINFSVKNYNNPEKFHITIFKDNRIYQDMDINNPFHIKIEKGSYIFNVMASWIYKGDVSYLYHIMVT